MRFSSTAARTASRMRSAGFCDTRGSKVVTRSVRSNVSNGVMADTVPPSVASRVEPGKGPLTRSRTVRTEADS